MFDNANGARLAARRLQRDLGIVFSQAREVVAKAGGWRDPHHMLTTVGTAAAPKGPSLPALRAALVAIGSMADPDLVMRTILPDEGEPVWERVRDRWTARLLERGHDPAALAITVPCLSFDTTSEEMIIGVQTRWWPRAHLTAHPSIDVDAASRDQVDAIKDGGHPAGRGRARAAFMLDDIAPLLPLGGGSVEEVAAIVQSGRLDGHQGDPETIAARMIAETWMADEACGDRDPVYEAVARTAIRRLGELDSPVWPDGRFRRGLPGHHAPSGGMDWTAVVDAIADDHAASLDLVAPVRLVPRRKTEDHPGREAHGARVAAQRRAAGFVTDAHGDEWRVTHDDGSIQHRRPVPVGLEGRSVGIGTPMDYAFAMPEGAWSFTDAAVEAPELARALTGGFATGQPLCVFRDGEPFIVFAASGERLLMINRPGGSRPDGIRIDVPAGSRLRVRGSDMLGLVAGAVSLIPDDGSPARDIRLPEA